jgi:tetratricopeptide (TPR) repeat protein
LGKFVQFRLCWAVGLRCVGLGLCLLACTAAPVPPSAPAPAPVAVDARELDKFVDRASEARSRRDTAEVLRWAESGLLSHAARAMPFDRRVAVLLDMKAHALWALSRPLDARTAWVDAESRCIRSHACEVRLRGDIERGLARAYFDMREYERARSHYSRSLAHLDPARDSEPIATTRMGLGQTFIELGKPVEAYAHFEEAIRLRTALGPSFEVELAAAHRWLGEAHLAAKDATGSVAHFERSLALLSRHESQAAITRLDVLVRLGRVQHNLARHAEALSLADEADALLRRNTTLVDKDWDVIALRISAVEALHGAPAAEALRKQLGVVTLERELRPPIKQTSSATPGATASGTISNAAYVVAQMRSPFSTCYNQELARDRDARGRVRIRLDVDSTGLVWRVLVDRMGQLSEVFLDCVMVTAARARFDPPAGGSAVVVAPVAFVPKGVTPRGSRPHTP